MNRPGSFTIAGLAPEPLTTSHSYKYDDLINKIPHFEHDSVESLLEHLLDDDFF